MIDTFRSWWTTSEWPDRLMLLGGFFISLASILLWLQIKIPNALFVNSGSVLLIVGSVLLASGYLIEIYRFSKSFLEKPLGKLIGALLLTCLGAVTAGMAAQVINQATGLDPTDFDYAVAFIAPFTAISLIVILVFIIFLIQVSIFGLFTLRNQVVGIFASTAATDKKTSRRQTLRFLGAFALFGMGAVLHETIGRPYRTMVESVANAFIINLEFYGNDPCAKRGERIRRLSDDIVVVATPAPKAFQSPTYTRRSCPLTAPPNNG